MESKNLKSPLYFHLENLSINFGYEHGIPDKKNFAAKKRFSAILCPLSFRSWKPGRGSAFAISRRFRFKKPPNGLAKAILQVKNFDCVLWVAMGLKAFSLDRVNPFDESWYVNRDFVLSSSLSITAPRRANKFIQGLFSKV